MTSNIEVRQTPTFRMWLADLKERQAAERISKRLLRLQSGLLGDIKPVGGGVSELRVDADPDTDFTSRRGGRF